MPGLTVTEKEFWKERIACRIARKVEAIMASHPRLFERLEREAQAQALESLGLATAYAELEAIKAEEAALGRRRKLAQRMMVATLRGVPLEEIPGEVQFRYGCELAVPNEVYEALGKRRAVHRAQLMADDPVGREIACWEAERESLLDTVWLATSPTQVRALWTKVGELLGDVPTPLEREALAIESVPGA